MRILILTALTACITTPSPQPVPAEPTVAAPEQPSSAPAETIAQAVAQIDKINVNTASKAQLAEATGAGPKMVHEFEEYRPYASIQQFRKEIGKYVDAAKVAGYEQHLYVPVAFNDCDVATLQQLPGLDTAKAQALVAGRPYTDATAFAAALGAQVTPEQLAVGRGWLVQ